MKKYKVRYVVMNRLSSKHIPYFVCLIVQGPNGGLYAIDDFSTSWLLREALGSRQAATYIMNKKLLVKAENVRYVRIDIKASTTSADETVRKVAKIYEKVSFKHVSTVIRGKGHDLSVMADKLDTSFLEYNKE